MNFHRRHDKCTRRAHRSRPDPPTPDGQGYPNEIRLLQNTTDGAARSYLSPVIIRFYGMDPSMDTNDFNHRVWGGVAPPKVEYLGADGRWVEVRSGGCTWLEYGRLADASA